jgi:drug/metabolite transporter (DMT)-like permease
MTSLNKEKVRLYMPVNSRKMLGVVCLLTVYLIWGTTFGAIRMGVSSCPPFLLICTRFLLAGILTILYCLVTEKQIPSGRDIRRNSLIGLLIFFGGNTAVSWAVQYIPTGLVSTLTATTPVFMNILASAVPPYEPVKMSTWWGLLTGFIGIVFLVLPKLLHPVEISFHFWVSIFAVLGMAFFWACGSIYARVKPAKCSLLMSVGIQSFAAGLALIPIVLTTMPSTTIIPTLLHMTPLSLWALVFLVFFGSILATPCYLHVLKTFPVSISSTFAYVTPIISTIFGFFFLKETVSLFSVIGMAIIFSGVLLIQRKPSIENRSSSLLNKPDIPPLVVRAERN